MFFYEGWWQHQLSKLDNDYTHMISLHVKFKVEERGRANIREEWIFQQLSPLLVQIR